MGCVLDLLVFLAQAVFRISPVQLAALMMAKLLAQDTVEALAYRSVRVAVLH